MIHKNKENLQKTKQPKTAVLFVFWQAKVSHLQKIKNVKRQFCKKSGKKICLFDKQIKRQKSTKAMQIKNLTKSNSQQNKPYKQCINIKIFVKCHIFKVQINKRQSKNV